MLTAFHVDGRIGDALKADTEELGCWAACQEQYNLGNRRNNVLEGEQSINDEAFA